MTRPPLSHSFLESLYNKLNHRRYVHPDPLEFLYRYRANERDIAALVASALAYGRVAQILKSIAFALSRLPSPLTAITDMSSRSLCRRLEGFRHRFTAAEDLAALLFGAGKLIVTHGALGHCFSSFVSPTDRTVINGLIGFTDALQAAAGGPIGGHLLADPRKGSACKRLNLLLRWMVRKDAVDPGGWRGIGPAKLIIPLDTHMHRFALSHGLTHRKSADMKTALEITAAFGRYAPSDPTKYDFTLTRAGIWKNTAK